MKQRFLAVGVVLLGLFASVPGHAVEFEEAAESAYSQAREGAIRRGILITSGTDYERIGRISRSLIASAPEMKADAARWNWDVSYIRSSRQNAFCLPGGKIVVLSGLVEGLSLTDDEVAAVLGHEIAHAALEHGKESYNQRQVARVAVGILGIVAAVVGARHNVDPNAAFNATTGLGSLGAEFFALRPYGRDRELEADRFGMELAARAGFDPHGAVSLQQKMAAGGSSTPEFLSTHPSPETRVQELHTLAPATLQRFASRRVSPSITTPEATSPPGVATASVSAQGATGDLASGQVAVALAAPGTPTVEDDPDAVTGPNLANLTSKYMINGEQYAKAQGCIAPSAKMTVRAPTYETFAITCSDNRALQVRCRDGTCGPAS